MILVLKVPDYLAEFDAISASAHRVLRDKKNDVLTGDVWLDDVLVGHTTVSKKDNLLITWAGWTSVSCKIEALHVVLNENTHIQCCHTIVLPGECMEVMDALALVGFHCSSGGSFHSFFPEYQVVAESLVSHRS